MSLSEEFMKSILFSSFLILISQNIFAFTKGKTYKITILHTNDHHGNFWPNKDGELGLAPRATIIQQIRDQVRKEGGHVLLLDAGDVNTGVPQSDMQEAEPDFKGMALLGYDVMAVGNHEFDKPFATLMKQLDWAGFPFISANIYHKDSSKRVFPSHIIKELDDLKVTIFGLTTEDTPYKSNPLNTAAFKFIPAVEEAKRLVPSLRPATDVLIALTHMGHYPDEEHKLEAPGDVTLARQVPGIDVIVGGHTQNALAAPDIQNGSILLHAGGWGKYLGRLDLEFLDGKLKMSGYQLVPINLKNSEVKIEADHFVENFLRPFQEKGEAALSVKLGTLDVDFPGDGGYVRTREAHLGNLIALAFKLKMNADIGLTNSGGIRNSLPAGDITYGSILRVLPFANQLALAEMSGRELVAFLEKIIFTTRGSGAFPQISGLKILGNSERQKITSLEVNGKKICLKKKYTIALPEFVASGGDKYPVIPHRKTGFIDADVVKDFVLERKSIRGSDFAPMGYFQLD
jgi:5'-nucleotidase / UDP-sugar diphosphatase